MEGGRGDATGSKLALRLASACCHCQWHMMTRSDSVLFSYAQGGANNKAKPMSQGWYYERSRDKGSHPSTSARKPRQRKCSVTSHMTAPSPDSVTRLPSPDSVTRLATPVFFNFVAMGEHFILVLKWLWRAFHPCVKYLCHFLVNLFSAVTKSPTLLPNVSVVVRIHRCHHHYHHYYHYHYH
jgi:hypothetical protein